MPKPKNAATELFTDDLARLKGAEGLAAVYELIEKRAAKVSVHSGDLVDTLQDTLEEAENIAKSQKDLFSTNINLKSLQKRANKEQNVEQKAIYQKLVDQGRAQVNLRKKADESLKSYQKKEKVVKNITNMIPGVGGMLGNVIDDVGVAYKKGLGKGLSKSESGLKSLGMGFKSIGVLLVTGIFKNFYDNLTELGVGFADVFSRPEFLLFGKEMRALSQEFGNIDEGSAKLGFNMKLAALFSGVTAENQAKILGAMAATSDASLETLHSQMMAYKQAGVPFRAIMDDVANNMEFTAKFAKDGGANIFEASKRAKELGINLGDVSSISNSLLDFESSIEKQMEAQVLLGRNLNLDKARQLAFSGDTVGLQNEILRQVGSEAEFNKMNYLQREALAGAIGLSVERMSALVREESKAKKNTDSWFNSTVGIVAAIGGALGMLIGGLTGGAGFARMVGYGMSGVAAGGAIGKLASTVTPKLAEGGIINTPTLAMIGERGPEAVVPLAEGAGAAGFNMKETNTLLRALLGSSEKQVNRLGDIGTS